MRSGLVGLMMLAACSQAATTPGGDGAADVQGQGDVQFATDADAATQDAISDQSDGTLAQSDGTLAEVDGLSPKDADSDAKDTDFDQNDGTLAQSDGTLAEVDGLSPKDADSDAESADSGTKDADFDQNDGTLDESDGALAEVDGLSDIVADVPVLSSKIGCADGTREGFADLQLFPTIAACGGAWDQPGIFNMPAKCNNQAGNDGVNAAGTGCTVSDLCLPGWHVCYGKDDVVFRNSDGCAGVMTGATPPVFFTTQMSSTGAFQCASGANATNDLFGCGNLGCDFTSNATVKTMCAPLGLSSHDLCKGLRNDKGCGDWCNHLGKYPGAPNSWDCGSDGDKEALNVVKSHPEQQGGVLCCLN